MNSVSRPTWRVIDLRERFLASWTDSSFCVLARSLVAPFRSNRLDKLRSSEFWIFLSPTAASLKHYIFGGEEGGAGCGRVRSGRRGHGILEFCETPWRMHHWYLGVRKPRHEIRFWRSDVGEGYARRFYRLDDDCGMLF